MTGPAPEPAHYITRNGLVDTIGAGHHGERTGRRVRQAPVGGRCPVEMAIGLALILISVVMIAFIVRTVQANLPR